VPEEETMSTNEPQSTVLTQKTQPAAPERPATSVPPKPTSQAERAVMHPPPSPGLGDRHDPDWRYYHACGA
jgi:hypothetical protein